MEDHPLILADRVRREQFALLGYACRPFQGHELWTDPQGVPWAVTRVGGHAFAVTWLGPGWVFDPYSRQRRAEDLAARSQAMKEADADRHRQELAKVIQKV